MDGQLTRTNCDQAGDNVVPNVLSPRDLVSRPDNMDETVQSSYTEVNTGITEVLVKLDLMFMKHYAPNRCFYIKVAKLRTGVGSAEPSYEGCSKNTRTDAAIPSGFD